MPAKTFDNVKGEFPIGFKIWDTNLKNDFEHISADIYNEKGEYSGTKNLWAYDKLKFINDWIKPYRKFKEGSIATIIAVGSDFQNQRLVRFGEPYMNVPANNHNWQISKENLIETSIYFSVRHCIEATWLNDRDQFLYPQDGWQNDTEFQGDCLAFTLFSNNIQSKYGTNHWIPFTEQEVNAREKFESNFMTKFIKGKLKVEANGDLFGRTPTQQTGPLLFSAEAQAVFDAGCELWKYYHAQPKINVNASLYDIREYFQGRNEKGKMNNKSEDERYMKLITELRQKLKLLAHKIEPKVYQYQFLKE